MKKTAPVLSRSLIGLTIIAVGLPAAGAPLPLSTAPPGTPFKPPAPNVIVSVDNSGSMSRGDRNNLRNALAQTFSAANVPDGQIRLAWQAMNACRGIPNGGGLCLGLNGMKPLSGVHRTNFLTWVDRVGLYSGGTPSHLTMMAAGNYLRNASPTDINGPWASDPGTTLDPVLGCRRSYQLFMTDGGWNPTNVAVGGGNPDGTTTTLPDGTVYDAAAPESRVYRDIYGSNRVSTFADLAFYFWATDLQPRMPNIIRPKIKRTGNETFTQGGLSFTLPEYWNPRNDPATWQHLTTYTIGYRDAASWGTAAPAWDTIGNDNFAGGLPGLIAGAYTWEDPTLGYNAARRKDLWHAAVNSRGRFVPARTAQTLVDAFGEILNEVVIDETKPLTSIAVNSNQLRQDGAAFVSGYEAASWAGQVTAHRVTATAATLGTASLWGTTTIAGKPVPVTTATLLDARSSTPRKILTYDRTGTSGSGIAFEWAALSSAQKALFGTVNYGLTADNLGQERLQYIRGLRRGEATLGGPFRDRTSALGDIVNSQIWYAGKPSGPYRDSGYGAFATTYANRTPMVYVGGNDGMLHAFTANVDKADTPGVDEGIGGGEERFAYVPLGVQPHLTQLTRPDYQHRYYVDGSPFTGDVQTAGGWKTYLAGFLGAGGKGYFMLDVTDPSSFASASPSNMVVLDQTDGVDPDMGHIAGTPLVDASNKRQALQITRMNNGRWAMITGNGYNSTNENAVLLVQYLDGAKELVKIAATSSPKPDANGLSTPQLIDLNGDQVPDVAYAGDLHGNLWKFDLGSTDATQWKTATFGNALATPLYTALDATGTPQPITGAPVWRPHPRGGIMVAFGTGRNLTDADRASTSVQSLYGVYDNAVNTLVPGPSTPGRPATSSKVSMTGGSPVPAGRASLVEQRFTTTSSSGDFSVLSSNAVDYAAPARRRGWFVDLPAPGERNLANGDWFDGNLVEFKTVVPAHGGNPKIEACGGAQPSIKSYSNIINIVSGGAPRYGIYDVLQNGTFSSTASRATTQAATTTLTNGSGTQKIGLSVDGRKLVQRLAPRTPHNAAWRQMR